MCARDGVFAPLHSQRDGNGNKEAKEKNKFEKNKKKKKKNAIEKKNVIEFVRIVNRIKDRLYFFFRRGDILPPIVCE